MELGVGLSRKIGSTELSLGSKKRTLAPLLSCQLPGFSVHLAQCAAFESSIGDQCPHC